MLIYFVRHGNPDYKNDSLTDLGFKQALAVKNRLEKVGITKIYSSPAGRSKKTAEPLAKELNLDLIIIPQFEEYQAYEAFHKNNGWAWLNREDFLGKNECFKEDYAFSNHLYDDDIFAKNRFQELGKTFDKLLEENGYKRTHKGSGYEAIKPNDSKIAIFSHQGNGLHLLAYLLNISPNVFTATFDISHAGISIVEIPNKKGIVFPRVLTISDTSHYYKENLPMKYNNETDI